MSSHGIMRDEFALGEELDGAQWGDFFERIDGYQTNSGNVSADEDEIGDVFVDRYFGALSPLSASSLRRNKNSGVATLPYKKATCYGFCPTDETEALKAIKCKDCKQIIKVVGYGHHMRLRHGYRPSMGSSASNSGDDCQDFLLSPPHLPMLASTSNILNPELGDNSPTISPSRPSSTTSVDLTGVNSAEAEGRISSPPYYVEHCNDLVLVMKRSPHKSMSEKVSSQSRDEGIGKDSTLGSGKQLSEKSPQVGYRTPQRRKRKGRKKEDVDEYGGKDISNSVADKSVSKLRYREAGFIIGSPSSFGEFMEREFMTNSRDDVLRTDDLSRSSIDSVDNSSTVNSNSAKSTTSVKRKLLTSLRSTQQSRKLVKSSKTVKRELPVSEKADKPEKEEVEAPSSQQENVVCLRSSSNKYVKSSRKCSSFCSKADVDESKNSTKTVISQLLHFPGLSMTALTSDGKSSPLKPMLTSFSSPDLLSGAKRHLSSDGFTSDYREAMLSEMDSKNLLKISNRRTHIEGGAFRGQLVKAQHPSCSLPLSPSSESNSSSSVSDEASNLSGSKCIELHTCKPGMDSSTTQMRTFLLRKAHEMRDNARTMVHDESISPVVTPLSGDGKFFAFPSSFSPSTHSSPSSPSSSISMLSSSSLSNTHLKLAPFFSNNPQRLFQRGAATNFFTLSAQNKILNPKVRQMSKKLGNSSTSTSSSASPNTKVFERPKSAIQASTKLISVNMKSSANDGEIRKAINSNISLKNSTKRTFNGSPSDIYSSKSNTNSISSPSTTDTTPPGAFVKDKPLTNKIYDNNADLSTSLSTQQPNRAKLLQNANMLRRQVFVPPHERLPQNFQRGTQNMRGVSTERESLNQAVFSREETVSANENVRDGLQAIPMSINAPPNTNSSLAQPLTRQQLDNLEHRHQRQMMMRAAQATGGAASVFKETDGQLRDEKINDVISPRTLAQKRMLNQNESGQIANNDGKFHPKPNVQISNFPQMISQPSIVKKFRPIVPRQRTSTNSNLATVQTIDQRNGTYRQNNSPYGVYLTANKSNNSQLNSGMYSSEAGLSFNSPPISTAAKMEVNLNKYPQKLIPKMPTYRPIAQKRVTSSHQQQVGSSVQTPARYGSGLTSSASEDVVCFSVPFAHHMNNTIANGNTCSNNDEFSSGNEPFNEQQNGMNVYYGPRRIVPGGSANEKILVAQPQYAHMVQQAQNYERIDNFSPSRLTKQRRSPSSTQLLMLHQNNNASGLESGSVGMSQFQNIEPPPILEAEGRIPAPGSNLFTARQNPPPNSAQPNSYEIGKPNNNSFVHQKQNLHHVQVIHRQPNQLQTYIHAQRSSMQPYAATTHHPSIHQQQRYAHATTPQQQPQFYQPANAAHFESSPQVQPHYYHNVPQHFVAHREHLQQSHHARQQQMTATPTHHPTSGVQDGDENA